MWGLIARAAASFLVGRAVEVAVRRGAGALAGRRIDREIAAALPAAADQVVAIFSERLAATTDAMFRVVAIAAGLKALALSLLLAAYLSGVIGPDAARWLLLALSLAYLVRDAVVAGPKLLRVLGYLARADGRIRLAREAALRDAVLGEVRTQVAGRLSGFWADLAARTAGRDLREQTASVADAIYAKAEPRLNALLTARLRREAARFGAATLTYALFAAAVAWTLSMR